MTEVLQTVEALLELAPDHPVASRARRRAWRVVGIETVSYVARSPRQAKRSDNIATSTQPGVASAKVDTMTEHRMPGKRIIAWVDGVGGFLICLDDEIVLGQPATVNSTEVGSADLPIRADLSRRHATIRRDGESYVLTPIHRVQLDGIELSRPTVLATDAVIQLGDTVRLRFRRPHALSLSAVLTIESHHKTEPAVDHIVLMSESCILGPQPQSHIHCRAWSDQLVLFRHGEDLQFRSSASIEVDGESAASDAVLAGDCRIEGENFALSIEHLR